MSINPIKVQQDPAIQRAVKELYGPMHWNTIFSEELRATNQLWYSQLVADASYYSLKLVEKIQWIGLSSLSLNFLDIAAPLLLVQFSIRIAGISSSIFSIIHQSYLWNKAATFEKRILHDIQNSDRNQNEILSSLINDFFQLDPEKEKAIDAALIEYQKRAKKEFSAEQMAVIKKELEEKILHTHEKQLAKRVSNRLAKELRNSYNKPLTNERAKDLLDDIQTQLTKRKRYHLIVLDASALNLAWFALCFVAVPPVLPTMIFALAILYTVISFVMSFGMLEHREWNIDWRGFLPTVPAPIRSALHYFRSLNNQAPTINLS